jgi:two-component system, cell cycle sensor histidine kinase and response regulator CckA
VPPAPRRKGMGGPTAVALAAAALAAAYWLIDSGLHAHAAGVPFVERLIPTGPHDLVARVVVVGFIALLAIGSAIALRRARLRQPTGSRAAGLKSLAVMENIQELIALQDKEFTVLWANKAAGDSVGLDPADLVGRHCYEIWHERTKPCVVCPVFEAVRTGVQQEHDVRTPDGRSFYIKGYPVTDDGGKITGAVEITLEITARKRAEEALAREKERLAVTLASIGEGAIATDTTGAVTFMNRAAEELTGWRQDEALGRKLSSVFTFIDEGTRSTIEDPTEAVLRTGAPASLPEGAMLVSRGGQERLIADSAAPIRDGDGRMIGMILVFRDVAEKRRLEEEIRKSQKLESLGILAGGIAHDFNNVLTGIIGNASVARLTMHPDEKLSDALLDIEKAALRARKLTQQLLTFSKGGAPIRKATSLGELIGDTVRFALSGSNVSPVLSLPDDLRQVDADAEQISHTINNIVMNAREAMPEGGSITVQAENVDVDGGPALPLAAGKYVKISLRDTGVGMPREDLSKIFDPYFTTKGESHSGLGLAVAYFVVKKHGGLITVDSEPEVSTTFTIYLPAAAAARARVETAPAAVEGPGHGRILVMDDEEIVRKVLEKILGRFGYETAFAKDGAEAVDMYRSAMEVGRPFDAVIMDLTVTGGMGGREAIELLRLIDPSAKAIVSSGYSDDPVMADFRRYGFDGVIAKPFRADELREALGRVLAAKREP